jgi:CRP/FNR family cyclic AMP-dependent transcriptional regulator
MNWIEAAGYAGTGFTIMSYSMRGMLALRIAAVLSSASFLAYAGLIGSYPLVVMEVILLPINGYRLLELLRPAPSDIARRSPRLNAH